MKFIDENGFTKVINDKFSYHGVELVTVKNSDNKLEVFEPAYGVQIQEGQYDILFSTNHKLGEISKDLDERSVFKKSCESENNYLPEIAFNVIKENKSLKNPLFNKSFVEKVENLRQKVMQKVSKGVAIGFAFAVCASFAPKLSAQTFNVSYNQPTIKHIESPADYYKELYGSTIIDLNNIQHMLNEDAKSIIKENYPNLKESSKQYSKVLSSTIKELATSSFGYNYLNDKFMKMGSRLSVEDNTDEMFEASFFSDSNVLVLAEANRYISDVGHGKIEPKLEINQTQSKHKISEISYMER